jgi:ABC-type transporter lipoprotein component MlaA
VTAAGALRAVNQAPDAMKTYDALTDAAIDPYVSFRDAYASRRAQQVRDQLSAKQN